MHFSRSNGEREAPVKKGRKQRWWRRRQRLRNQGGVKEKKGGAEGKEEKREKRMGGRRRRRWRKVEFGDTFGMRLILRCILDERSGGHRLGGGGLGGEGDRLRTRSQQHVI
ncbi:hypothetical protein CIPAW_14G018600 [Carya illinoinensis]|uniref:Uncharacterized protein n=1 Tax=Carya illinoinensis TaxID=32201 RepID=A0A8T1NFQ2_CARIL|nr:hypothetical protein CIPAW_14G018600 [Carya illinoinensis]